MGVPTLACRCPVCTSPDPHDRRLRPSILLRWREGDGGAERPTERIVVIDTGPDFREQALRERLSHVDAVFYTHGHADHMLGMDDLRPLSFIAAKKGGPIPLYADPEAAATLERILPTHFRRRPLIPIARASRSFRSPNTMLCTVSILCAFRCGTAISASPDIALATQPILTDVSAIPEESFPLLAGIDVLVISALRHEPHPSHSTVEQSVEWSRRIGARQTWFTHISHDLGHEETNRTLPDSVRLAHDGLTVTVTL